MPWWRLSDHLSCTYVGRWTQSALQSSRSTSLQPFTEDFLQEDIHNLAQVVSDRDPNSEKIIVFASAPPCPDFSRVCPDAPGKEGQEGRKFVEFRKLADRVRQQLPHPVKKMLCENVVLQDKGEISYFEKALGCSAVVLDSTDFGLVSRPRLFWTDIQ